MSFTPNPFDYTGTLDTTNYGRKSNSVHPQNGVDDGNTSVAAVVSAFTDASLATDAANRVQPGQLVPAFNN